MADPLAGINLAGAVPLDPRPTGGSAPAAARTGVVEVTEANFAAEVIERSRQVPVVLDFWASWCGPCRQLSPVLERLAGESGGSWVLATIDVDANPRLAQAAGVQGIPAVKAVLDGAVVAEFTGALPESQVREWIQALLAAVGSATDGAADAADVGAADADLERGAQALAAGDLAGAEAAFTRRAEAAPGDPMARSGLARVGLLRRAAGHDRALLDRPVPADAAGLVARADLLVLSGRAEEALRELLAAVARLDGAEREAVRARLVDLFEVLGDADPRVPPARRSLAAALF